MTTIPAEHVEIVIQDGNWRLLSLANEFSDRPEFWVLRGSGVMEYTPAFAQEHRLPGTVLSVEYVRAVVIGYEQKSRRWRLGFHVSRTTEDQPRWLELVRWPESDNDIHAAAAQRAGRELAEHIGCPLKIFGAKKQPSPLAKSPQRSGITGPLTPHKREDIGPQRVKLFATSVKLPVQYPGIWLGEGRNGVTLRLAKDTAPRQPGSESPAFNQCVIDVEQETVRLIPPTGLLGVFLGGASGRELSTADVRNVELRHEIMRRYERQSEEHTDLVTEVTNIHYTWGVYLTLPDESLLLAQTEHTTSSELSRKRATVGDKFSVDTKAGIAYFRQHQEDQEAYEQAETFARTVAVVIASTLGARLVKTEIGSED